MSLDDSPENVFLQLSMESLSHNDGVSSVMIRNGTSGCFHHQYHHNHLHLHNVYTKTIHEVKHCNETMAVLFQVFQRTKFV